MKRGKACKPTEGPCGDAAPSMAVLLTAGNPSESAESRGCSPETLEWVVRTFQIHL